MSDYINTYCSGPELFSLKNISKREFVELCINLENEFNNFYNTKEYSFSPECITEGGIIFNNFNEYNTNGYKTMRIYFIKEPGGIKKLYGYINKNIKNEWINEESILIEKNKNLGTCLKSFKNAPEWTNEELKIFENCFKKFGLIYLKNTILSKN